MERFAAKTTQVEIISAQDKQAEAFIKERNPSHVGHGRGRREQGHQDQSEESGRCDLWLELKSTMLRDFDLVTFLTLVPFLL